MRRKFLPNRSVIGASLCSLGRASTNSCKARCSSETCSYSFSLSVAAASSATYERNCSSSEKVPRPSPLSSASKKAIFSKVSGSLSASSLRRPVNKDTKNSLDSGEIWLARSFRSVFLLVVTSLRRRQGGDPWTPVPDCPRRRRRPHTARPLGGSSRGLVACRACQPAQPRFWPSSVAGRRSFPVAQDEEVLAVGRPPRFWSSQASF